MGNAAASEIQSGFSLDCEQAASVISCSQVIPLGCLERPHITLHALVGSYVYLHDHFPDVVA